MYEGESERGREGESERGRERASEHVYAIIKQTSSWDNYLLGFNKVTHSLM